MRAVHSYKPWTALKIRGRNMNTPTKHEQLSKQREEYSTSCFEAVHSYKPRTALKISGRNMNTPTNHEQLSWNMNTYKPWTALKTRGRNMNTPTGTVFRNMNTPTNHEQLSKQEGGIWTLLTMKSSQNKRFMKYVGVFIFLSCFESCSCKCSYFSLLFWELFMVCRSVHISAYLFWELFMVCRSVHSLLFSKQVQVCRNVDISAYLFWEQLMVCRSVHISASCFDSSYNVGVFILPLVLRARWFVGMLIHSYILFMVCNSSQNKMVCRSVDTLLQNCSWFVTARISKQEAEIWTLLQAVRGL